VETTIWLARKLMVSALQVSVTSPEELRSFCAPASANIEEYITMVAAGLAATTPHMISATITALSRLLFEYQGEHSPWQAGSLLIADADPTFPQTNSPRL
jgi:hypothetical protein